MKRRMAANSAESIQADEAALTSNKPPHKGHPELMPHQATIMARDNAVRFVTRRPATARLAQNA